MTVRVPLLLVMALSSTDAVAHAAPGADWLQTARVFLIDAYYPPMAPELEFDAASLAATMKAMNVNTVRIATMGKYATIQGVRFTRHPDQGDRDLLAEMVAACKPRGIRVVHMTNWTGSKFEQMLTKEYYLAPVEDVVLRIRLPKQKHIRSVRTFVGTPSEYRAVDGIVEMNLSSVEAYQAVHLELE